MPCNMMEGYSSSDWEATEARRKADEAIAAANKVTDILCRVLKTLPSAVIQDMDPEVRSWFEQHQAHDKRHGR